MMFTPYAIINYTPDSFSDGGIFFGPSLAKRRISALKKAGITHFDIGAQSTAPKNSDIGEAQEINRLKDLFTSEVCDELYGLTLSIDTFRPNVANFVYDLLKKQNLSGLIWNDVSGQVDDSVINFLKLDSKNKYVLSHNLVRSRSDVCQHMNFINELNGDDFLNDVKHLFQQKLKLIPKEHINQITLDCCFGFSKTTEQNYVLIKNHYWLEREFPEIKSWLVGISRKSFLKKVVQNCKISNSDLYGGESAFLSILEKHILDKYFKGNCNYFIRTHLPENLIICHDFDAISKG